MFWLILASISTALFLVYNIVTITYLKRIPYSLSGTYYLLNDKKEGLGIWFSVFMIIDFLLLMSPWAYVSGQISQLGSYLTVLPFICCSTMIFVGIAPNIKTSERIERIHIISALIGAITALLWIFIVCWRIAYIVPACILLFGGIAHLTKTAKSSRDYWLEMCAFFPTFTAIIVEFILNLHI